MCVFFYIHINTYKFLYIYKSIFISIIYTYVCTYINEFVHCICIKSLNLIWRWWEAGSFRKCAESELNSGDLHFISIWVSFLPLLPTPLLSMALHQGCSLGVEQWISHAQVAVTIGTVNSVSTFSLRAKGRDRHCSWCHSEAGHWAMACYARTWGHHTSRCQARELSQGDLSPPLPELLLIPPHPRTQIWFQRCSMS